MKQRSGFTLVELLIAAALMGLLLTALSGLFVSTIRAYRTNERVSESQQNIEAAIQLLKYEIALAGYRGTDAGAGARKLEGSSLTVTLGSGTAPDSLTVRYFEDRAPYSPALPNLEVITYSVAKDANNVWNLYRKQGDAAKQPAVEGVTNLKVVNYRLKNGSTSTTMPAVIGNLVGLTLALSYSDGVTTVTKNTTIPLPSGQCTAPTPPCDP